MSCVYPSSAVAILALLAGILGASLYVPSSTSAASPVERIALQLSGSSCRSQHATISSAVSALPGVQGVDLLSIPEHVLIDIDSRMLSPHDLLTVVAEAMPSTACHAEPMQSCISADMAMTVRSLSSTKTPDSSP